MVIIIRQLKKHKNNNNKEGKKNRQFMHQTLKNKEPYLIWKLFIYNFRDYILGGIANFNKFNIAKNGYLNLFPFILHMYTFVPLQTISKFSSSF